MYTIVYWTLRGFMCAGRVVRWRGINVNYVMVVVEIASSLGYKRVCVEVV